MANGTTPSNIGTQGSREKFQWPKQSDELEHFVTFTPSRYSRSKREDPGKRTRDAVITLPIPYTLVLLMVCNGLVRTQVRLARP